RQRRDPGPGADAAVLGRRRRDATAARHRRRGWTAELDPTHPGTAAGPVRVDGNSCCHIDRGDLTMKRITALLHPNRIGEVVHALAAAGHRRFSVLHAQGLLQALNTREQTYSVELGELST